MKQSQMFTKQSETFILSHLVLGFHHFPGFIQINRLFQSRNKRFKE